MLKTHNTMKKNYLFVLLLTGASGSLAFMNAGTITQGNTFTKNAHINGSGAPSGRTGAPGESNCTECHSGSVQSGAGINQIVWADGVTPVTDYTPGSTYNVAVTFSTAAAKNGFQVVALNPSNAQAGTITLIPSSGTQLLNGAGGKKYVTHTTAGNAQTSWAFQWTAPATNVGDVTFYLATNQTNSNNNSTGDVIRLSQHVIGSVAGVAEAADLGLEVGYSASANTLNMKYNALSAGSSSVNIVDLSGKSVFNESIGTTEVGSNSKAVKLPSDLKAGVYMIHLNVNNNFASKKIYID
jgi:hypothetical protein